MPLNERRIIIENLKMIYAIVLWDDSDNTANGAIKKILGIMVLSLLWGGSANAEGIQLCIWVVDEAYVDFLKEYPNDIMAINIPELSKLLNKAERISDLIQFFSNSPLESLKKANSKF